MFSDYYNEERKRKELEEAGLGTSAFPQVYLQRGKVKKEKSEADPETSSIEAKSKRQLKITTRNKAKQKGRNKGSSNLLSLAKHTAGSSFSFCVSTISIRFTLSFYLLYAFSYISNFVNYLV